MKLAVKLDFGSGRELKVGTFSEIGRDSAFEFAGDFISSGLNPAPFRLPVKSGLSVYDRSGNMDTFGLFDDSLPDGWGRKIVDRMFMKREGRLPTLTERLMCVGRTGKGALVYEPADEVAAAAKEEFDLAALADDAMAFDAGEAEDSLPRLRRAGGSSGGARPKAYVGYNPATGEACAESPVLPHGFEHWIVKFNTRREGGNAGEREFLYYRAALEAGAEMAPSRIVETKAGKFFMTRRFDRMDDGGRLHMASAAGLLHADFRIPGDEYAVLFRLTDALTHDHSAKLELFRRACLNVIAHNRDDHLKNFSFLMDADGKWRLSPFYDFTYSDGPNGWQTLSVAGEGANPGEEDLRRLAKAVGLDKGESESVLDRVREACRSLK
ncbi:MAG: HipA domain-containing protein [Kiritimatiellae bacterium]|nr:HipA domain-containing protein [Kiritimatiellia bacterium]